MAKQTILLVEDDTILRDMYKFKFEHAGYLVKACADAPSALHWLASHVPDCAVVDILLPGINGIQLIKSMRRDARLDQCRMVILTNLSSVDINLHETVRDSLGVDGYFVKSQISPSQLIANIGMLVSDTTEIK